jgi:hypothetical protein
MILVSLFALVVKTSGVNVVRLIRVFRVCFLTFLRIHVSSMYKCIDLTLCNEQVVRVFGKFPSLRRIITALTSCVIPMIGAFSVLIIFICLCKDSSLHPVFLGAAHLEWCPDSILGVALFGAECPEFFESFDRSFMTLFRIAGAQKTLLSFLFVDMHV